MLWWSQRSRSARGVREAHSESYVATMSPRSRRHVGTTLVTAAVLSATLGIMAGSAPRAQQKPRTSLNVSPVMLAEPASRSPMPIQVGPQDAVLRNSFVRIRGLPAAAALSEGHSISPGAWAVPLSGLPTLHLVVPVGLQGRWEIAIGLVTIDGTVLTEAKTMLIVGPAQLIAPVQPKLEQPSTNVASLGNTQTAALSSPERERALSLHSKGIEFLERGNIQPARMFFMRAAEAGLAESALALGGTYDPVELARRRVLGLQPDPAAARRWYTRARELGATEAAARLRRLDER